MLAAVDLLPGRTPYSIGSGSGRKLFAGLPHLGGRYVSRHAQKHSLAVLMGQLVPGTMGSAPINMAIVAPS